MSENKSLATNRRDVAAALARGTVGAIPIVGSLVAEIVDAVIPGRKLDRVVGFLDILAARLGQMQENQYYDLVGADIENAGGTVVKFLGDACLSVFPPEAADQAIDVLLDLRRKCDDLMSGFGWKTSMGVRAHFGTVAAGEFGTGANRHFDIVGSNVNLTFRLPATGVVLTVEAFRQLGADRRRLFKKHTPPIFVYTCRSITRASLEEMRMPPEEPTEWWRRSTAGSPSAAKVES